MTVKRYFSLKYLLKNFDIRIAAALFIVAFGILGTVLLFNSHAATPTASIEAESGTVSSAASALTDSSASGNQAVKFGASSGGGASSACPAYPAFPDANCTGVPAGTNLTTYTGPMTIDTNGTVIDSKIINGCIAVFASNVTIKNSRITCQGSSPTDGGNIAVEFGAACGKTDDRPWCNPPVTGLTMTNDEIGRPDNGTGGLDYALELWGNNVTLSNLKIHNLTSGIHLKSNNVVIRDSYFYDLRDISGQDHTDGIIANGGTDSIQILHNNINYDVPQTTPIAMYPEGTPNTNWLVNQNLLNGGGYCIYPSYTKGSEQPNNHDTITNNHFGTQWFSYCGSGDPNNKGTGAVDPAESGGYDFMDGPGNIWSGNVWDGGPNNGKEVTASGGVGS